MVVKRSPSIVAALRTATASVRIQESWSGALLG